ncbi:72 kDa type IV collagenase [Lepeophtheirus salmonis]|uniref:72 kDa type IV collagenase n=1 Tax=Lepeophtheirus salmonis TaxID=72036 RepID=UPI001AE929D6|nr:72 kDa type IV collagenase-like [Lepeophtheirus salmonis]
MKYMKVIFLIVALSSIFLESNGQNCLTKSNRPCIFPFIYKENIYGSCTEIDSNGKPWCAVSVYHSTGHVAEYGFCYPECAVEITKLPETCKTVSGTNCIFPFKYNHVEYNMCTSVGTTRPWCGTSLYRDTDEVHTWDFCNSACEPEPTPNSNKCLTIQGQECVSTFSYHGIEYYNCTSVNNNGVPWCATTVNESNGAVGWGICQNSFACA